MYYALQPFNTRLWLRHDIFFLWYPIPPSGELILPQLRILHCPRSLSSDNRSRKVEGWDVEENAGFIEFPTNLCSSRPNGDTEELKCTQEEDERVHHIFKAHSKNAERGGAIHLGKSSKDDFKGLILIFFTTSNLHQMPCNSLGAKVTKFLH